MLREDVAGPDLQLVLYALVEQSDANESAMKEKLLFVMPDSLEEVLFASVVMSQYLISRMVMGRPVDEVVVVCRHEELHGYLNACWAWAVVVTEPTRQQIDEADLVFEFDAASSYRLTKEVQKHIAEAFAIQLGVGLMRFLPPVLVEDVREEPGLLLLAERNLMDRTDESWVWPHLEDFGARLKEGNIPISFLPECADWEQTRAAVGRASVVVGVRSSVTLIAAAANRLVMELSPDDKGHKEWFRKKECGTYRMMYGKLQDMTSIFVWSQIEKLMTEARGYKPPMAEIEEARV